MALGDGRHNGQAKTTTTWAFTGAPKTLKHMGQIGRGQARAVVLGLQHRRTGLAGHTQGHHRASAGVVQGVVKQVVQGFSQEQGLALDGQGIGPFIAQVNPSGQGPRRPVARHVAGQGRQIQRLQAHLGLVARQRQQLLHQVGAALGTGQHLAQALTQGLWVGLGQRQLGLADQAGQRRAQLVGGVIQKALLLAQAAPNCRQQLVHSAGQGVHLLRRLRHLDGAQRRQALRMPVAQLRLQPLERPQATGNAAVHQHTQHGAQQQQGRQHVGHQLLGDALLHRQAFGHLDPHALRCQRFAVVQIQQGHPHRLAVDRGVVQARHATGRLGLVGRAGQHAITQQKLAWRRGHGVADAVFGVLLDDVLRRTRKINQQARAHRLDLPRQREHRLCERLVNAFFSVAQGNAVSQHPAHQPEHQLGQQQPQQQLALQRQAVARGRRCHGRVSSSR